jgi:putative transposase
MTFFRKKEDNNLSTPSEKVRQTLYKPRPHMHLVNYDYQTAGAYAMTICAHVRHDRLFSMPIVESILKEEWNRLTQHFANITPDLLVIMPDHLHCIIWHHGRGENTKSIIKVIGGYKSLCTVAWRRHLDVTKEYASRYLWQRNFYDHIIRNEKDLEAQRIYMLNNPIASALKQGKMNVERACEYNSCGHIPFPLG